MSRIAKSPIAIPAGVELEIDEHDVVVNGPKGSLRHNVNPRIEVTREDDGLVRCVPRETLPGAMALAGTTRALVQNMITGVSNGFERRLQLVGVGYRAQMQGNVLNLTLGYSHPITFAVPEGITVETPTQTEVVVKGIDKQRVGQTAAVIRGFRPPEPYKGKGVRYADENIVRKEAKKK